MTVRASVLPPNFQLADPTHYGVKGAKLNQRWECDERLQRATHLSRRTSNRFNSSALDKVQTYDANIKIQDDFIQSWTSSSASPHRSADRRRRRDVGAVDAERQDRRRP